jgi:hypothetical protein
MDGRGLTRKGFTEAFQLIVLPKSKMVVEIIGFDEATNEIITNRVYNKGTYAGHSYVLEQAPPRGAKKPATKSKKAKK